MTHDEARHLLQCEGGELSAWDIAVRVGSAAAVAGLTARAIVVGDATVWHLALPMLAQYVAVTLAVPALYVITPHSAMLKDVNAAVRMWAGLLVAAVVALGVQVWLRGSSEPGASALRLIG